MDAKRLDVLKTAAKFRTLSEQEATECLDEISERAAVYERNKVLVSERSALEQLVNNLRRDDRPSVQEHRRLQEENSRLRTRLNYILRRLESDKRKRVNPSKRRGPNRVWTRAMYLIVLAERDAGLTYRELGLLHGRSSVRMEQVVYKARRLK